MHNTAGGVEVTRSFAEGSDILRYWTKQLDEPRQMVFVSWIILSRFWIEQVVAGRQLKSLQQIANYKTLINSG